MHDKQRGRVRILACYRLYALLLLTIACIACAGCAGQRPLDMPVADEDMLVAPDTTLGPGDVFDVRVYGEKELSKTFRVDSDGSIDFPLVGKLAVLGKTPSEVSALLEQRLIDGEYLRQPQISILVKEYNSKKISVFGQVKKPGTFLFEDGMSVVEAVSKAGGFAQMARADETIVIRDVEGQKKRYTVPVEAIAKGRAPNFFLRAGDIVFVPERIF